MPSRLAHLPLALALLALALLPAVAAAQVATDPSLAFHRLEAMVPMRDGVRLETQVFVPRGAKEKLPVLFMRTPYGFGPDAKGWSRWLTVPWLRDLLRDGYVLALQSVRGRFRSEGVFVIEPELRDRSDPRSVDEGTDAFDTVEWLLSAVPNNGRVGLIGVSNPARLVAMAMLEHHPAVKAYSPGAIPADNFLGDDFFHGGAFRLPLLAFVHDLETSREFGTFPFDRADAYDFFLALGSLAHVDERWFHGKLPTWNALVAHPTYDAYWQRHSLPRRISRAPAPTLHVGGAFDQEDKRGPVVLYQALEKGDDKGWNHLVIGPWAHRSWRLEEGDRLGRISFGSPTARWFREEVQAPFFACHLKERCGPPLPAALVFQTGRNVWQRLPAWPPRDAPVRSLHLRAGGRLSAEPPGDAEEVAAFPSDPRAPVPSQPRPVIDADVDTEAHDAAWPLSLVVDQRFVQGRPDVLTFTSEPLAEDVVVHGDVTAHLFVSTTGTDADFVAKLVDVHPDLVPGDPTLGGYQLMVAGEILRGRFRRSFERPEPFAPGKVEELAIDLRPLSHVFLKGHRIQVQVHSTWFPLYDRNPQVFVENVFLARDADFTPQTHRVHLSRRHPSRVTFATARP
jgi:putative CocE/NonD family hydrolase